MNVPFNIPYCAPTTENYIRTVLSSNHQSGNGKFTALAQRAIEKQTGALKVLLTHSCTGALELASLAADLGVEDEVIIPSFTFVSSATAVMLRGATPVFVDIDPVTLNIDPNEIDSAITERTKAIMVVHYAGVACDMHTILSIAEKNNLLVIEDAAQAIGSSLNGRALGTFGDFGCYSFHDTKNVHCGQGGAILIQSHDYIERCEVMWEKGTNRKQFINGLVDKYTWCDLGSSFLLSEINAAMLFAQLETLSEVNNIRLNLWNNYNSQLEPLEKKGFLKRPHIPKGCDHNAHIFYVLLNDKRTRDRLISYLSKNSIQATFHYLPLHNTKFSRKFTRANGHLSNTVRVADSILRLPLYPQLNSAAQSKIIKCIESFFTDL